MVFQDSNTKVKALKRNTAARFTFQQEDVECPLITDKQTIPMDW